MDVLTLVQSWTRPTLVSITLMLTTTILYKYYTGVLFYWKSRGIPGPIPLPLMGTAITTILSNRMKLDSKRVKKYGKVYGLVRGLNPVLMISDPELLIQICVKDFDHFQNHDNGNVSNIYQEGFLFFLRGDHWKRVRSLMSPTFTSGKMKRMYKLLDRCADDLCDNMAERMPSSQSGRSVQVNLKEFYNLYTMDAIASCCYGLKLERSKAAREDKNSPRNQFIKAADKVFQFNIAKILLFVIIPKPIRKKLGIQLTSKKSFEDMVKIGQRVIDDRRKMDRPPDDYLQLILDAKLDQKMELDDLDVAENHHASLTNQILRQDQEKIVEQVKSSLNGTKVALTDSEVLSSTMFLLFVGLETTATLLTHCTVALSFHEKIQDRLYEEIKKIAEYDELKTRYTFNYDDITSCRYLDAVISETLRILPPLLQIDRQANSDYYLEKYKLPLPEGSLINLCFYSVMNDPDYWYRPDKFDPDRFMPGNREKIVPGSYCPFGLGPRHCIGMRFSLTETKLALAKLIMIYKFEKSPKASFPPKPNLTMGLLRIKHPYAKFVERQ